MKLNKSLLAILMITTLLLGMLAGCNKTPESTDTGTDTNADTDQGAQTPAFSIVTGDNGATVTTQSGFTYTAGGYDTAGERTFSFTKGLTINFGDQFAGEFNRFTIKYFASAPMKITLTYTEKDELLADVFYLEAGEKDFSAVNPKFLTKVKGEGIASMQIDTCEDKNAEFMLYDLKAETISVPNSQQYIEGSRYILGIDLKWGGSINHVEDKECPMEDVTNMCNKHDEGRLIQQSYYGVFY